jgi:[ribosomal protein S18]-alanine N-acetyltransferase
MDCERLPKVCCRTSNGETNAMKFTCTPMNEEAARAICAWHYEGEYSIYNIGDVEDTISEMLDRRSPQYAVHDEPGELVGFFAFGTSATISAVDEPALYAENNTIFIGLGMRPDLTGQGLGLDFINAELDFARQQFAPEYFRLYVLSFNKRAIRAYEKAGFERVRTFMHHNIYGDNEFVEMMRKAAQTQKH